MVEKQEEILDTVEDLAKWSKQSKAYWRKRSREPGFPRIEFGRSVRFSRRAVLEYITGNKENGDE